MRVKVRFDVRVPAVSLVVVITFAVSSLAADSTDAVFEKKLQAGDFSRRGADTCLSCHEDSATFGLTRVFANSHGRPAVHGSPFSTSDNSAPAGLQCEACHGPIGDHGRQVLGEDEIRQPMLNFAGKQNASARLQNGMCLQCHDDHETSRWDGSAHDLADVACADCHQIHASIDLVQRRTNQIEVCEDCHTDVIADVYKRSSHPMRPGFVGSNPLVCADCHEVHGSDGDALTAGTSLNDTCFNCHAEKRGPFLWEHGPAAEDCSICHVPHGSNQKALLVRRPPQLCQGCHSAAGHRNIPQLTDQLPPGTTSEFLLANACMNCHTEVHGSNHPSGDRLRR